MNIPRSLRLVPLLALASGGLLAAPLDFSEATCRVVIGAQSFVFPAGEAGKEITIDGKPAQAGERRNSLMRVNWIIAPIEGIGDEYVFVIRRPNQKPRTYAATFKGGYLQIAAEEHLLIEVED